MQTDLRTIVEQFAFEGRFKKAEPWNFGHINDTFILHFELPGTHRRYVLQRINHNVFKAPEQLMANMLAVTCHLREKIVAHGGDPERETVNLVPTHGGQSFYKCPEGNYWRASLFIDGARTYQAVEQPTHFFNAGKAFGQFQKYLSDFPADTLHETISRFHDTAKRFNDLMEAVEQDAKNRAHLVKGEIAFVEARAKDAPVLVNLLEKDLLPLRVTHNDTKLNNVMFDDKTGEGICVLDLDTVMPGSALYDFGDSIRFGASTAAEDEPDLSTVWMDLGLYQQFTTGYLAAAQDFLTPLEIEHLPFSAKLLTFECGMRFLTDYLNGDTYFKIQRPNQNLDRARTQFKLVADMERKMDRMHAIVQEALDPMSQVADRKSVV